MTALLVTVDTELSAAFERRGMALEDNLRLSIWAEAQGRETGIRWLMAMLERYGLKGVFFLDPLPALVHGTAFLRPIVEAILSGGHEVQMHIHTEWLEWATDSPVDGRQGRNIGDFGLADQIALLGLAKQWLEEAGAPPIQAFRAGNFGANDDTLRALSQIGVGWDSSVNPAYLGRECAVSSDPAQIAPRRMHGVIELPVSGIADRPGGFRPAQVCAMSTAEMRAGLAHAVAEKHPAYMVVTHSFEMLSRDRQRPNGTVMGRFENLCRVAADLPGAVAAGFADLDPRMSDRLDGGMTRSAPNRLRTVARQAQQAWATWRYERRLVPA